MESAAPGAFGPADSVQVAPRCTLGFLAEFEVSRSTWDRWLKESKTPRVKRLPNGKLRIRRDWVDAWSDALPDVGVVTA